MSWNCWAAIAALNGAMSVAAGAFGAHGLRDKLEARHLEIFETGARYQMYHALAMLAVAWLASRTTGSAVSASGYCFLFGTIIFSGSLYALAVTGINKLGMVTPIGGLLLIAGWMLLAYSAIKVAP